MEWVTAQYAARAEVAALDYAEALDRGVRIARAARVEAAARPEQRADHQLIEADDAEKDFSDAQHRERIAFQCLSRLARRSSSGALAAPSRALTVTSTAGNSCWFK